jgi:hypothetical protein
MDVQVHPAALPVKTISVKAVISDWSTVLLAPQRVLQVIDDRVVVFYFALLGNTLVRAARQLHKPPARLLD